MSSGFKGLAKALFSFYIVVMKKILFILLVAIGCSEDEPVFRIEDPFFESRWENFVEIAESDDFKKTVPKNNLILRSVKDSDNNINDSKAYREGDQLYVDIDKDFQDVYMHHDGTIINLYQHLAHGLFGTPYRDCGIMKKIVTPEDIPWYNVGYGHYANLFDPSSPCVE